MDLEAVTDGELAILDVIWDQSNPTSRDIADVLYDKVTDSKMASVQKLIERLEAKKFVVRDRSDRAHRFTAIVSREKFLQSQLRGLADRFCKGALGPLVTTLIQSKGFSKRNREELRKLIDEQWPETKD